MSFTYRLITQIQLYTQLGFCSFGLALFLVVRLSLQIADSRILFAFDDILIILFIHLFSLSNDLSAHFKYHSRSSEKVLGLTL